MKTYMVTYWLADMLHTYTVDAGNEHEAIMRALETMPAGSAEIMHNFMIERVYKEW